MLLCLRASPYMMEMKSSKYTYMLASLLAHFKGLSVAQSASALAVVVPFSLYALVVDVNSSS